jgi:hypothetical protein
VLAVGLLSPFLTTRIGPGADLSITDAYTIVALVAALPFISLRSPDLRRVLLAFTAYLAVIAAAVVVNPSVAAFTELAHRGLVYGSAVLVGAAIVQSGQLRRALRLFVAGCSATAALAVVESARSGFAPAYPLDLQKNAAGLLFAAGILVLLSGRRWLQLSPPTSFSLLVVCGGGLLAAQSRSAFIALAVVLVIRVVLANRRGVVSLGGRVVMGLLCVALAGLAWTSIRERDLQDTARETRAVDTRVAAYDDALDRWREEPVFGIGLRYWDAPVQPTEEPIPTPHSLLVGELGEAGLVGLLALFALLGATALVLARRRDELSDLALDVFALRMLQGLVEIFWVAGPLTLGTLFVGLGLATEPGQEPGADPRRAADADTDTDARSDP